VIASDLRLSIQELFVFDHNLFFRQFRRTPLRRELQSPVDVSQLPMSRIPVHDWTQLCDDGNQPLVKIPRVFLFYLHSLSRPYSI
jgi:hypothetical protein